MSSEPQQIGELEVIRRIGAGGFGVVYLATDRRLGRKVALKLAHPGRGDLWREARAAARLAHPNVVTIFEVGDHEGNPYIVMEYVDGPTLRDRLAQDRLPLREALRIARDLAAAITAAHREGIVHLDLTPANVMLAADGRARVVDFGLARTPETVEIENAGTPAYMAPEQWRREPPGAPADVWALGALVHVLVAGVPPIEGSSQRIRERVAGTAPLELASLDALPSDLATIVRRCLNKDVAQRPAAADVANAIDAVIAGERRAAGPFRGLAAFDAAAAAEFHGRDEAVSAVRELLVRERVVTITGASGVGKSSFVHAGVAAAMRDDGWKVATVRPGRRPLAAIASAVRSALPGAAIETRGDTQLDVGERDLGDQIARWAESPGLFAADLADAAGAVGDRFALVIDQLEELETLADADARHSAVACLAALIADDSSFRIVLTVRDDYASAIASKIGSLGHVYSLREPDRDQLRTILERTVETGGAGVEAGLADAIAGDLETEPGAPALVQLIGAELWETRDRDRKLVTRNAYDVNGGAAGALASQLRAVLARCTPDEAMAMKSLLRRCARGSVVHDDVPASEQRVLERLIDARVIVARKDDVVLAHRELAARPPLSSWLADERELKPAVLEKALQRPAPRRIWLGIAALGVAGAGAAAFALTREPAAKPAAAVHDGPECSSFVFPKFERLTVFNVEGKQDAINAISMDGHSVVQYRRDCNDPVFTPVLIDELPGRVVTFDISKLAPFVDAFHSDGHMTMSADALTVIIVNASRTGFITATRSARGLIDFVPQRFLDAVKVAAPAYLLQPVISADRLAFYYQVIDTGDPEQDGIYESVRSSVFVPFPQGRRMPALVNFNTDVVNGISSDRLTLFVQTDYYVSVFTRKSLAEEFVNPNFPVGAPLMPGFRTRPYDHCQKLIGTCVSGCNNEDSCSFSH